MKKYLENKTELEENLKKRGVILDYDLDALLLEIKKEIELKKEIENLRFQINQNSKDKPNEENIILGKKLKHQLQENLIVLNQISENNLEKIQDLPNILNQSVPFGTSEEDNVEIERSGEIKFSKHHYDMDIFLDCVNLTGSRFVVLKDKFAKLERALGCFMMEMLSKHNFEEFSVPYILTSKSLYGTNHLPKEHENMFKIEGEDKYLIPTSECFLANLGRNQRWNDNKKFCAMTDCFRKEAGSAGKDIKGLIRLHQFKKCEMVCFSQPNKSYEILEEMLKVSLEILKMLDIPFRVIILCSKDTGFNSSKTYDIEIPVGNKWREVASISNTEDFQSNNMNCKNPDGEFLHILNGSALAIGRTLASLIEVNYDINTNKIQIPKVLHKYLDFTEISL